MQDEEDMDPCPPRLIQKRFLEIWKAGEGMFLDVVRPGTSSKTGRAFPTKTEASQLSNRRSPGIEPRKDSFVRKTQLEDAVDRVMASCKLSPYGMDFIRPMISSRYFPSSSTI